MTGLRATAAVLALAAVLGPVRAGQDGAPAVPLTLREAVGTVLAGHPAALAAAARAEAAAQNVRIAFAAGYLPRLSVGVYTGLVPEARGDIFSSPDLQTDLDGWGLFGRFNLDVTQPLATFGRAGAALAVAREGSAAASAGRDAFLQDLAFETVRAFEGVLAATAAESLARESRDRYRELLGEIEKRLAREDTAVDDEDLLEARSRELEIETLVQTSLEKAETAGRTLAALLGREAGPLPALAGAAPPSFAAGDDLTDRMAVAAAAARPDVRALDAAVRAAGAKVLVEKRRALPTLYLAGNFGFARAPNRQDQTNPFAVDNFNYRVLGGALGLRWDPDLFGGRAQVRQAEAERRAAEARLAAAREAAGLDAARFVAEARRNDALLAAARRSFEAAKSWLRLSQENWDTGLGDAYRLLRAYRSYFELRGAVVEREFALNMSLAGLARALGDTGLFVTWVERGKVDFD